MENKYIYYLILASYLISRILLIDSIYLFDDTFITFRFAENLANSNTLIYNLNENFLGVSTPIYALFCAFLDFINIKLTKSISYINILFELISLILIIKYLNFKNNVFNSLLIILISISPYLFRITLGGMESNLFFLVSITSIVLFIKKKYHLMSLIASINCFIRPEGMILILILLILLIIEKEYKLLFQLIGIGVLVASIGLGIIYQYYNTLIPQSVSAKAGLKNITSIQVLTAIFWKDKVSLLLLIPSIFGYLKFKKNPFISILFYWMLSLVAFYLITKPLVWTWYSYPIWMAISILGIVYIYHLIQKIKYSNCIVYLVIFPIIFSILIRYKVPNNIKNNIYSKLETYFEDFEENKHTIYANDIGAIGYYSKQYIYDSESLIHDIAINLDRKEDIIKLYNPDFLFINNTKDNFIKLENELKNYKFVKAFMQNGDSIFPKSHSDSWTQDYLLYQKID